MLPLMQVQRNMIKSCTQVLEDELCYKYSEYHNIFEVFATRARMFRSVYLHK